MAFCYTCAPDGIISSSVKNAVFARLSEVIFLAGHVFDIIKGVFLISH